MTIAQLRDSIKRESKTSGTDEMDVLIVELFNEILRDYTGRAFYPELFVAQEEIALLQTLNQTPPSEIQHFLKKRIWFKAANGVAHPLIELPRHGRYTTAGTPHYFLRVGADIQIYPYQNIAIGDKVLLDYYKFPDILVAGDEFPISKLESTVKKEVIARIIAFDDPKQYSKFKQEAGQSYIAASASNAG